MSRSPGFPLLNPWGVCRIKYLLFSLDIDVRSKASASLYASSRRIQIYKPILVHPQLLPYHTLSTIIHMSLPRTPPGGPSIF
jgi:hypothetical protein